MMKRAYALFLEKSNDFSKYLGQISFVPNPSHFRILFEHIKIYLLVYFIYPATWLTTTK